MGKVIPLYAKKTPTRSRKWSLPAFKLRARRSQEAIQALCVSLTNESKLLKRKKRSDYHQYVKILQIARELRQQSEAWSITMYDDERLPFAVYIRRYPLLSACYHIQQCVDELINLLMAICTAYTTNITILEETQLRQDIVLALTAVLECGKEVSFETMSLLDQLR